MVHLPFGGRDRAADRLAERVFGARLVECVDMLLSDEGETGERKKETLLDYIKLGTRSIKMLCIKNDTPVIYVYLQPIIVMMCLRIKHSI